MVVGNGLEAFDFVIFGFLAVALGTLFFPKQDAATQVLLSLSVFGAGYLIRPLGSIVLGAMADRYGRKQVLTLTLFLMALGTGLIGILPTYGQIGILAPVLMVLARMIQGFSAGGEVGTATTYLVESAPPSRRGFYSSFQIVSQSLAFTVGGLLAGMLSRNLPEAAFHTWGWRVPFLIGVLILPVGMIIRRRFEETLDHSQRHASMGAVFQDLSGNNFWNLVRCLVLCIPGTVTLYIGIYMTTYAIRTLHQPMYLAVLTSVVGGILAMIAAPLAGSLSDAVGRKPVIVAGRVTLILSILPAFLLLNAAPSPLTLCAVGGLLFLCNAVSGSAELVFIPESLPARVRTTGFSIAYGVTASVFGGGTPVLLAWLVNKTNNPIVPAWVLIAVTVLALVPLYFMRETVSRRK